MQNVIFSNTLSVGNIAIYCGCISRKNVSGRYGTNIPNTDCLGSYGITFMIKGSRRQKAFPKPRVLPSKEPQPDQPASQHKRVPKIPHVSNAPFQKTSKQKVATYMIIWKMSWSHQFSPTIRQPSSFSSKCLAPLFYLGGHTLISGHFNSVVRTLCYQPGISMASMYNWVDVRNSTQVG